MTIFGWDASHYDGALTRAILERAKAEGISFLTHKVGEGASYDDPGDLTALAAARDAGIEFLGGYFVPRSGPPVAAQVDYLLHLADRDEPWWRDWPGWFWQVDLERWSYDNVPASVGIAVAKELRDRTGRWTILYASNGQYGSALAGWDGPLWNAHYASRPAAPFAAMYPGDGWRPSLGLYLGGWAAYSGREPTILQYASSATIAGLTTCDANAFRGSIDQLRALIEGGDMALDPGETSMLFNADAAAWGAYTLTDVSVIPGDAPGGKPAPFPNKLKIKLDEIEAAVKAGQGGGVDVDALAQKVAALILPAVTAANSAAIADELAKRLGNG